MKILLLCGNLSYAGAQRQMFELANGLKERHEVLVCSISDKVPFIDEFRKNDIKVKVLGLRKRNFFKIIRSLQAVLKDNNIEIMYSFLESANTYSRTMKIFNPKLKVVSSERSSDTIIPYQKVLLEKGLSNFTDLYIANSFAGKAALENHFQVSNIEVVHNGIDTERFLSLGKSSLDLPKEEKILICQIGRIKPDKNYELFLDVAEHVCENFKHVLFLAIGDQPDSMDAYQNTILEKRNALKNKDRILFVGKKSDIPEILAETDISMLTSHREGCSNTVLESMFASCPVAVTNVGDNKIMLSDANQDFISKPDDVEEMVGNLTILIKDPSLRKEIGTENYKKAQKEFTNKMMIEHTESLLLALLNR